MAYDFVVVGGGSAGCVVASRLVGEFDARVLLLEQGRGDRHPFIRMPAGFTKLMGPKSSFYTHYQSTPQSHLNGRCVSLMQARVLGGGSSLNAMTYMRGTKADYDGWNDALGNHAGWSWDDVLPYFVRQEANQRFAGPLHGTDGPLPVSDSHHPISDVSRAFLLALQRQGLAYKGDFNDGTTRGVGLLQSTTYRGERWSASRAFLDPLEQNSKLTIQLGAKALRILFDKDRAIGVEYAFTGSPAAHQALAESEVIVCAGTFATAQLLLLSGIGPACDLRRHGIKVRSDVKAVGLGFQDHYDARIAAVTAENFGYTGQDRGWPLLRNGLQYVLFGSGPVSSTGSEVTGFINPLDPEEEPSIQFYCLGRLPQPAGVARPSKAGATLVANLIAPKSRGSISLNSPNSFDPPRIDPNWFDHPADMRHLVAGVRFLLEAVRQSPLRERIVEIFELGRNPTDEEIDRYCRLRTSTNWHPVGSCRMGKEDDPEAVVDTRLRVRGVRSLRVMDGSIMPRIVGANTNAPIMMIADRGVDLLMKSDRRGPLGAPSSASRSRPWFRDGRDLHLN